MHTNRKPTQIVGALFLIALILNLIASEMMNPVLDNPDYLLHAFPEKNIVIVGNLLNFICGIAMIFIPIFLFPVVRKKHKSLASAYIVFRALEGILFVYLAIKTLSFIPLSEACLNAEPDAISAFRTAGNLVHAEIHWATIIYIVIFTLGGATFYYLLFKTNLVPRFLSVWGFLSIVLLFLGVSLAIFKAGLFSHMPLMKGMTWFAPPIALNELVLGIWLIANGFSSPKGSSEIIKEDRKRLFPDLI